MLIINFISSSNAVGFPSSPGYMVRLHPIVIIVLFGAFFVKVDLKDHLFVSYLLAAFLRDILISDDLECFCPGDAFFLGFVISFAYALAEMAEFIAV